MVKKLLRIATTFGVLVAGYFGYTLAFAVVAGLVRPPQGVPILDDAHAVSVSTQQARQLALTAFGLGHWSIDATIQYYDNYRGYWIFARDYTREDEGKKWTLRPFALIWKNRRGQAIKTLTADEATLIFTSSPDFVRPGQEPAHVSWAEIKGRVWLRDDKGTPAELGDDLTIGELDSLVFSEKENAITSDSPVVIRDRDTLATSDRGVRIVLRPRPNAAPGAAPGYDGARSIHLLGAIRVFSEDVGRTGIVPGGAIRPERPDGPREPRPGEITCKDGLLIDLPEPRVPPRVGPPAPQGPTYALFTRAVEVRQGDAQAPEQLNSDRLHLTLVPAGRSNRTTDAADGGPISDLTLRRAKATGHAVWLQSKVEHVVGYGNELIYTRNAPDAPDTSYFRGTKYTEIRKENPTDGTEDVIRTYDLTVYHGEPSATVIAGGPGWMQSRKLETHEVLRSATWKTRLVLLPVENDPGRRQLTLEGAPTVDDPLQGQLNASQGLEVVLAERARAPAATGDEGPPESPSAPEAATVAVASSTAAEPTATPEPEPADRRGPLAGGAYRIERVRAWREAKLVANGPLKGFDVAADGAPAPNAPPGTKRTIHAREWLVANFEEPPPETVAAASTATATAAATAAATTPSPAPAQPVVADAGAAQAAPDAEPEARTEPAPKPPEPPLDVKADRIWAWVVSQPGETRGELREARLRGGVEVHQDPAPDKSRGFDVGGERVDLIARGEKLFEVRAYAEPGKLARVATDTFELQGSVLGLDQVNSYAVATGPGQIIQYEAGGSILGDALPGAVERREVALEGAEDDAEPREKPKKGPLTIAWGWDDEGRPLVDEQGRPVETWMKFFGTTTVEGRPGPAKAVFYNGVRAWTEESVLTCGQMQAYLDAPVDFRRAKGMGLGRTPEATARADGDGGEEDPARARVERIVCERDVRVRSLERDDSGRVTEERRVKAGVVSYEKSTDVFECEEDAEVVALQFLPDGEVKQKSLARGQELIYNKTSGEFWIPTAGGVDLYNRGRPGEARRDRGPLVEGDRTVRPVADGPDRRRPAQARSKAAAKGGVQAQEGEALPPLELTRIWFARSMTGRLHSRPEGRKRMTGEAEFFGNVRTMRAVVPDADATLDPDRPPPQSDYTVSRSLRVLSEPPPPGARDQADRVLVEAWNDIYARSIRPPSHRTAIKADDHMTYDSASGLSYVYGGRGGVLLVDQSNLGSDASYGSGSVVMFNHRTGQHRVVDPRSIQLIDPRGDGFRLGAPPAESPRKPERKKREAFPRIGPSDKERRNFTGR